MELMDLRMTEGRHEILVAFSSDGEQDWRPLATWYIENVMPTWAGEGKPIVHESIGELLRAEGWIAPTADLAEFLCGGQPPHHLRSQLPNVRCTRRRGHDRLHFAPGASWE